MIDYRFDGIDPDPGWGDLRGVFVALTTPTTTYTLDFPVVIPPEGDRVDGHTFAYEWTPGATLPNRGWRLGNTEGIGDAAIAMIATEG